MKCSTHGFIASGPSIGRSLITKFDNHVDITGIWHGAFPLWFCISLSAWANEQELAMDPSSNPPI